MKQNQDLKSNENLALKENKDQKVNQNQENKNSSLENEIIINVQKSELNINKNQNKNPIKEIPEKSNQENNITTSPSSSTKRNCNCDCDCDCEKCCEIIQTRCLTLIVLAIDITIIVLTWQVYAKTETNPLETFVHENSDLNFNFNTSKESLIQPNQKKSKVESIYKETVKIWLVLSNRE